MRVKESGNFFSNHRRSTRDIIERILGIKCCATCRNYDPETGLCHLVGYEELNVSKWWKTIDERKFAGADCFGWE